MIWIKPQKQRISRVTIVGVIIFNALLLGLDKLISVTKRRKRKGADS